eukprot:1511455-Alexandrium_andersonii.AAC.1
MVEHTCARACIQDPCATHRLRAAIVARVPPRRWAPCATPPAWGIVSGTCAAACWARLSPRAPASRRLGAALPVW